MHFTCSSNVVAVYAVTKTRGKIKHTLPYLCPDGAIVVVRVAVITNRAK